VDDVGVEVVDAVVVGVGVVDAVVFQVLLM
jgi:hypothetical protein